MPIKHQGIREVDFDGVQRSGESRYGRRDEQCDVDEPVGVESEISNSCLVLSNRDERSSEWGAYDDAKGDERRDEHRQGDVMKRQLAYRSVCARKFDIGPSDVHSVLAAGHVRIPIRDEVEHLPESDRQQPEIDAAAPEQKRTEEQRTEESGYRTDEHRLDEMRMEVFDRQRGAIGAESEVRRVAERRQARVP